MFSLRSPRPETALPSDARISAETLGHAAGDRHRRLFCGGGQPICHRGQRLIISGNGIVAVGEPFRIIVGKPRLAGVVLLDQRLERQIDAVIPTFAAAAA